MPGNGGPVVLPLAQPYDIKPRNLCYTVLKERTRPSLPVPFATGHSTLQVTASHQHCSTLGARRPRSRFLSVGDPGGVFIYPASPTLVSPVFYSHGSHARTQACRLGLSLGWVNRLKGPRPVSFPSSGGKRGWPGSAERLEPDVLRRRGLGVSFCICIYWVE